MKTCKRCGECYDKYGDGIYCRTCFAEWESDKQINWLACRLRQRAIRSALGFPLNDQERTPMLETVQRSNGKTEAAAPDTSGRKPFHRQCSCGAGVPSLAKQCPECGEPSPARAKPHPEPSKPGSQPPAEAIEQLAGYYRTEGVRARLPS